MALFKGRSVVKGRDVNRRTAIFEKHDADRWLRLMDATGQRAPRHVQTPPQSLLVSTRDGHCADAGVPRS